MRQPIIASLFFIASVAQAGSPLVTEDAAVLEQRQCEIETSVAKASLTGSKSGGAQVSCGTSYRTQLGIGAGRDSASSSNLGALFGKTALLMQSDTQAGLALAYTASFQKVHASDPRYTAAQVKLVLTIPHDQWLLHANAGWSRDRSDRDAVLPWNLAAERLGVLEGLDLMAEVLGDDRHDPWLQYAARWAVLPGRVFLNFSWGMQASRPDNTLIVAGLRVSF